jgi:hypothetical protein
LHFVHYYFSAVTIFNGKNLRKEWEEARIKSPFAAGTVLRRQFAKGHVPERVIMKLGGWKTMRCYTDYSTVSTAKLDSILRDWKRTMNV